MNAAATLDTLRPRAPDRVGRGAMLALLVHAALVVGLSVAVNWRTHSEPEGVEAELWAAVPQMAAPPAAPPQPAEEPVKPKVAPPPPEPVAKKPPPPPPEEREADIAREKDKERKAKELKAQQERAAAEEKRKRDKAEKAEKERADKERLAKEKAEKQKAEQEKQAKADQARTEKARQDQLARIRAMAGGDGAPGSTGKDAQTAGPSAGYAGRVNARVKPNITFTRDIDGNVAAVVEVRAAPDGTITSRKLIQSSGIRAWDDAVLRAIDKTEVLPRDVDGRVPSTLNISFRPRDL